LLVWSKAGKHRPFIKTFSAGAEPRADARQPARHYHNNLRSRAGNRLILFRIVKLLPVIRQPLSCTNLFVFSTIRKPNKQKKTTHITKKNIGLRKFTLALWQK
jgi:hypothetical protein